MFKKLTICFIGLGGAGQRHLRLLNKHYRNNFQFKAYRHLKKVETINEKFEIENIPLSEKYKNVFFLINFTK